MEFYPKSHLPLKEVRKFIVIFYCVGTSGFIVPFSRDFFIAITPFALLMNTYLLAVYHSKYNVKSIIVFAAIFLLGFFVEVIGVQTGIIFGNYNYGSALGVKFFDTPLMIGVNWLFMSYTSTTIADKFRLNKWLRILIAPLLMLTYDLVLEQVAPKLDMWTWRNSEIPIQNYIAWYLIAVCFVSLLKILKIETKNPMSLIIFLAQFVFFCLLTFLL